MEQERSALERLASGHNFAIVQQSPERLLGNCGLHEIDWVNRTAELGIFIGDSSYWGQGYGTEALRLLLNYGFSVLNFNSMMLRVNEDNAPAQRCYLKLGFSIIGRRRRCLQRGQVYLDQVLMDITAQDYFAQFSVEE